MSPGEVRKLLGGYAAGTLTEEERRALFEAALSDQDLFDELGREQALKELLDEPGARRQLLAALEAKESWFERFRGWLGRPVAWAAVGSLAAAVVLVVVFVQRAEKHAAVLVAQGGRPAQPEVVETAPAVVAPVPAPARVKEQAVTRARTNVRQDKEELQDRRLVPAVGAETKAKTADEKLEVAAAREVQPLAANEPQVAGSAGGRGGEGGSVVAPTPAESKPQALSAYRAAAPVPPPRPATSQPAAPPPRVTEQITVTAEAPAVSTQKAAGGTAIGRDSLEARMPARSGAQTALVEREQDARSDSFALDTAQMIAAAARSAVPFRLLRADSKRVYAEVPEQTVFRANDRIRVAFQPIEAGRLVVLLSGRTKPVLDKNVSAGSSTTLDVPAGAQKLVVTFTPRTARQRGATAVSTATPLTYEIPIQREPTP